MAFENLPDNVDTDAYFFVHNTTDPVPMTATVAEADEVIPNVLEFGVLNAAPLVDLDEVLGYVYNALLSYNNHKNENYEGMAEADILIQQKLLEQKNKLFIRDDFLINLQKFGTQINRTVKQIEGDIKLDIPPTAWDLTEPAKTYARDRYLIFKLEDTLHSWQRTISSAVEQVLRRTPQGNGPMAEIDFWRERNATLSALFEQFKLPAVTKVVEILSEAQSDSSTGFEYHK